MSTQETNLIALYDKKIALMQEVFKLTSEASFSENDKDVQEYVTLIEKREALFIKAQNLDSAINALPFQTESAAVNQRKAALKKLSGKIIELDNYMSVHVNKIKSGLKKNLKDLRQGKNMTNMYNSDTSSTGRRFDVSN